MKSKWLFSPYFVWMLIFIIVPLLLILYYGFTTTVDDKTVFTFENFSKILNKTKNADATGLKQYPYIYVIVKSVVIAILSTVICFVLGYPVAYILASKEYAKRSNLFFLFAAPMWMNVLLRTYAWLTLLEDNGAVNSVLNFFGLKSVSILYTDSAVLLGMVYNFLPFMILPIYTVLKKIDISLIEAAQDLGANPFYVFQKVVFPLSIPGIISGVTMVFMPAITTFFISNLLGGGQYILIGNLIERQFLHGMDWSFGSALSIVLMVLILISMGIFSLVDKDNEVGGAVI